ncbi:hypothetical protein YC2023_041197 [Brassica napus]
MESNVSREMKTRSSYQVKKGRENKWIWSDWVETALESCGIWSNHVKEEPLKVRAAEKDQTASLKEIQVKVEPLKEVAAEEGQTARLEGHEAKGVIYSLRQRKDELYQLVGRLREVESELGMVKTHTGRRKQDVIFSFLMGEICELVEHICDVWEINKKPGRWKRGTSCKKGKLRKLSKMWVMMSRLWRKGIKESMQVGECFYSAYMGESVESSGVMRKLETKGADERVTKEEWDEFVKYVYALATTRRQGAPAKASTSNKPIIVDSGASHHMISDRSLMSDVKKATGGVMIANGDRIPIEGVGKLKLFDKDSDAFYMPQFASNLLSVRKATIDLGCQVVFRPDDVEFQDLKTGRVIGRGVSKNNLYQLQLAKISKPFDSMCLSSTYEKIDSITWHARLGHPHARAIELIIPNMSFRHLECEACILGKHCRTVFPTSETTYEHCFDLVHSDVWTAPCLSRDSQKYFVTFIDEKSKYTWLTLLPSKDRVLEAFMNFQAYVSNQYNATVKVLRSDNGGEYISNAFKSHLAKHGIVHQTSCPYTPQQNGVAERKNMHLMEVSRSMMFHANVPKRFWSDAVQTACYLINRVPTKILKNLSPFEVLNKSKPVIDHLRVFGCVCYVMVPGEQRNKLEAKSTKAMFIGYSITQKGYKCYDPEARRVMVSREVKFVETKGYYEEKEWENLKDLSQAPSDKATILRVLLEKLGIGLSQDQETGRRESSNQSGGAGRTTPLDHERGNGTESGEQEQNQEDSGLHDQDTSQEVENNEVQSSGEVDEVQSSVEEQLRPASSEEEQVEPASVQTEDQVQALRRSTRIKRDPSNWVNTRVYYNAQAVEHPSQAVCSFAEFPEEHYAFMISLDESYVPRTYEEAMLDKEWKE